MTFAAFGTVKHSGQLQLVPSIICISAVSTSQRNSRSGRSVWDDTTVLFSEYFLQCFWHFRHSHRNFHFLINSTRLDGVSTSRNWPSSANERKCGQTLFYYHDEKFLASFKKFKGLPGCSKDQFS